MMQAVVCLDEFSFFLVCSILLRIFALGLLTKYTLCYIATGLSLFRVKIFCCCKIKHSAQIFKISLKYCKLEECTHYITTF